MEGVRTQDDEYSRRLPPPEAWKRPDKWMDLKTGLPKIHSSKLVLPTDDRGFVRPDEVVESVNDLLFWNDYDWPFSPEDHETAPDDHHFYFTANDYSPSRNSGSTMPSKFRELPTVIGRMPRQFHNVLHDFTAQPEMPDIDAMKEYHTSYMLAHRAFKNLIESARSTARASKQFALRQNAVELGLVEPKDPTDQVAKEFMKEFFAKHFTAYSNSVDAILQIPNRELIIDTEQITRIQKPHLVVRKMSRHIMKASINYTPILQSAS